MEAGKGLVHGGTTGPGPAVGGAHHTLRSPRKERENSTLYTPANTRYYTLQCIVSASYTRPRINVVDVLKNLYKLIATKGMSMSDACMPNVILGFRGQYDPQSSAWGVMGFQLERGPKPA